MLGDHLALLLSKRRAPLFRIGITLRTIYQTPRILPAYFKRQKIKRNRFQAMIIISSAQRTESNIMASNMKSELLKKEWFVPMLFPIGNRRFFIIGVKGVQLLFAPFNSHFGFPKFQNNELSNKK